MSAFHHISLLTKDRSENVRFYTEVLGLRFVKNTVNQENHRMLHYYYGDYQGSPGSVVTFLWCRIWGIAMTTNNLSRRLG